MYQKEIWQIWRPNSLVFLSLFIGNDYWECARLRLSCTLIILVNSENLEKAGGRDTSIPISQWEHWGLERWNEWPNVEQEFRSLSVSESVFLNHTARGNVQIWFIFKASGSQWLYSLGFHGEPNIFDVKLFTATQQRTWPSESRQWIFIPFFFHPNSFLSLNPSNTPSGCCLRPIVLSTFIIDIDTHYFSPTGL